MSISLLVILFGFACGLVAAYYSLRAVNEPADRRARPRMRLLVLGFFAPKALFSERGWRLRQRAWLFGVLTFFFMIVFAIVELLRSP